jgi:hypothetical protein
MKIIGHQYMPKHLWALMRNGQCVAVVPRGSPIEDVDFDTLIVSQESYEEIKDATTRT